MNGLLAKLKDNEFISFVSHFDFVCFVETFMETFQSNVFVGYLELLNQPLSYQNRDVIPVVYEMNMLFTYVNWMLNTQTLWCF